MKRLAVGLIVELVVFLACSFSFVSIRAVGQTQTDLNVDAYKGVIPLPTGLIS